MLTVLAGFICLHLVALRLLYRLQLVLIVAVTTHVNGSPDAVDISHLPVGRVHFEPLQD